MGQASTRKLFVLVGVAMSQLGSVPRADACCLTDWLFHRRQQTPTTAYYPAVPPPVAPAAVPPAAPTGECCGEGYCEETVVRYVPNVAYRTVWQPVPVTTYRRTVNYNPTTGLPITCTKPCTTYTYQARRVPYTTFRPVYGTVPVGGSATPPTTVPTMTTPIAAPAYAAPLGSAVATGDCNSCSPSAVPSYGAPTFSSPTYSSPSDSSTPYYSTTPGPSAADPAGATPWQPVNPGSAAPSASDWAPTYNGSGPSSDPADQKPRIDPDANGSFSSLRRPPTPAPYSTWNRADIYSSQGNVSANRPSLQDSSNAAPGWSGEFRSNDSSQWSSDAPPVRQTTPPATVPSNVRPLPNVEPYPDILPSEDPPLLNPSRDRTAMVRPIPARWASSTIAWPEQVAQHQVEQNRPTAQPPIRQLNYRRLEVQRANSQTRFDSDSPSSTWDQSGWRSGRR